MTDQMMRLTPKQRDLLTRMRASTPSRPYYPTGSEVAVARALVKMGLVNWGGCWPTRKGDRIALDLSE